jgi:hypothetical protein
MAGEREELELLRKRKRLQELEAKAAGAPIEPVQSETSSEPSFLDRLGQVAEFSSQQLPVGSKIGQVAETGIRKAFDVGGEAVAETLAGPGLTTEPLLGALGGPRVPSPAEPSEDAIRTSPEVAAGIGTGLSLAPDVATLAAGGVGGIAGKRGAIEALKKAFTSKGIGAQIGEAERAAGVTKRLTTTKALKEQLQLPGKGDFTDVANKVDGLLSSGAKLPKQFLSDFRVALKKALNTPAFSKGEPQALLLNIKDKADDAFNALVPGRKALSKRFAKAKGREQFAAKAKKRVTQGAIGLGGLEVLRRVLGQ